MINVVPWRHKYPSWADASASTSSLASFNCSNRLPLADFKPYSELYSPKVIIGAVSSAALVSFYPVLNDYNALIAAGGDPDSFDWAAKMEPHKGAFLPNLGRLYSIQLTKKLLQYCCVNSLEAAVADRLTKDTLRSASRKFFRHGRSLTFLSETFAMAVGADMLFRLATLAVDSTIEFRNWLQNKKRELDVVAAARWAAKRSLKMFIGSVMGALGFALGSFIDQKYMIMGGLMASLSELAISPACDALIGF